MADTREADKLIASAIYDAQDAKSAAEERLLDLLFGDKHHGADFGDFTFDPYDGSVEFKEARAGFLLTADQLKALWNSGFQRTWVNYQDGSERYYAAGGAPEGHYKAVGLRARIAACHSATKPEPTP